MDIINSYYYFESNPKNETILNISREVLSPIMILSVKFAQREYQIREEKKIIPLI